jgi:hypothetical protein
MLCDATARLLAERVRRGHRSDISIVGAKRYAASATSECHHGGLAPEGKLLVGQRTHQNILQLCKSLPQVQIK